MTDKSPTQDREFILFGMRIVGEFGAMIALPIVLFVKAGQWLDGRFETGILWTIIAFIASGSISGIVIVRKAKKYGKIYQEMVNRNDEASSRRHKE